MLTWSGLSMESQGTLLSLKSVNGGGRRQCHFIGMEGNNNETENPTSPLVAVAADGKHHGSVILTQQSKSDVWRVVSLCQNTRTRSLLNLWIAHIGTSTAKSTWRMRGRDSFILLDSFSAWVIVPDKRFTAHWDLDITCQFGCAHYHVLLPVILNVVLPLRKRWVRMSLMFFLSIGNKIFDRHHLIYAVRIAADKYLWRDLFSKYCRLQMCPFRQRTICIDYRQKSSLNFQLQLLLCDETGEILKTQYFCCCLIQRNINTVVVYIPTRMGVDGLLRNKFIPLCWTAQW